MSIRLMIIGGCFIMAATQMSCKKDNDLEVEINTVDKSFVKNLSLANTAALNLANLAATNATEPEVVSFAREIITDHSRTQADLKSIAKRLNILAPDSIDAAHVAIRQQLMALNGRAFDSVFLYTQVADHENMLSLLQDEIDNGLHPDIKAFANNYKPSFQTHRQKANSIAADKFPR